MDAYAPTLIAKGLTGMIGKGERSADVIEAMKKYGAVYFGAIGGAGALISKCVCEAQVIAYDDLGTEAIRKLVVKDFPAVVMIDAYGNRI
jgi:fumarate hydratase subunit beta